MNKFLLGLAIVQIIVGATAFVSGDYVTAGIAAGVFGACYAVIG
jgi:hypothetical protein